MTLLCCNHVLSSLVSPFGMNISLFSEMLLVLCFICNEILCFMITVETDKKFVHKNFFAKHGSCTWPNVAL